MNNKYILILLGLILLLILIFVLISLYKTVKKEKTKISFKESLDLAELPIVTFKCANKKLHFLLDTGSNISFLDKDSAEGLPLKDTQYQSTTVGVGGDDMPTIHKILEIEYKNNKFTEEFGLIDLSAAFKSIENESGIKLHGILGNRFFEKYKYILDFKELTMYK